MQCPECKNVPLKIGKITSKKLVLDQCTGCKGMWFDKGELAILLGSKAIDSLVIPKSAMQFSSKKCPKCDVGLFEFCYPGTLTLVDGCKQCEGTWLDNKEWKAISEARDKTNQVSCPKCQTLQMPAESCSKCGIIMAKYQGSKMNPDLESSPKQNTLKYTRVVDQSYADDIPGLKGSLLGMIDRTIKSLSSSIF